ncbi:hypothetical protein WA026_011636 [Henosepilachna vigintioctopunctata]|uniref:Uncharacterized protein n=1 Tax=Henosepilachna vigintioctopunctata TaxID=420089 RepID=A0AAW1TUH3_9CUCU
MQKPQIRKHCGYCNSKTKSAKVMGILQSKWLLILFILANMESTYGQFGFPILDNVVGEAENTIDKLTGGFSIHNSNLTPSKHKEKRNDVLIDFGDEEVSTLPNVVTAVETLDLDNGDNIVPTPEIVFESGNSGEEKNSDEIPYENVVSNVGNRDKTKMEQPPFVDLTVNEDVSERPTALSSTTFETLGSDGPSTPTAVDKLSKDSTDNIKTSHNNTSSTSSFAASTTLKTVLFGSTEPPITSVTTEQIDVVSVTTDKLIENYTTTSSLSSIEEHSSVLSTQQNIAPTDVGTTTVSPILTSPVNIKELATEQSNNNSELPSTEFRIITSTVENDSSKQKEFATTSNVISETTTEFSTTTSEQPQATTESTATSARLIPSIESAVNSATPGTSIESPSTKQSSTFDELTTFPSTMLNGHSSTNTLPKDTYLTSPSPIKLSSAVPTSNADKIEDTKSIESIPVKTTKTIGTEGASTEVSTTDINTAKATNVGIGLATNQTPTKSTDSIESVDITTSTRPVDNISHSRTESSSQDIGTTVISTTLDSLPNNIVFDEDVVEKHHPTSTFKESDIVSTTETPPRASTVIPNTELTSSKKPEDIATVKTGEDETKHTTTKSSEQSTPAVEVDNHTDSQIESATQDIRTAILSTTSESLPNNVAFDEDVIEKHQSTTTFKQSDPVASTQTIPKDTTLTSNAELTTSNKPEDITKTAKKEEDEIKHTITKSAEQTTPAAEVDNHTDSQIESATQDIRTAIFSTTSESLPNNVAFDEDVVEKHQSTTTFKQSDPVASTQTIPKDTTMTYNAELTTSNKPEDITKTAKKEEDEIKHTITKSAEQTTPAAEVDNHTDSQIESATQDIRTAIFSTTSESLPNNIAFDEDVVEKHQSTTTLKQSDPVASTQTIPKDTTLISNGELTSSNKPEDITKTVKIEEDETKHTTTKSSEQSTPAVEVDNHTDSQIESATQDIRTAILSTTPESLPNNVAFDEDVVEKHHSTTTLKQSNPETPTTFTELSSNTEVTSSKKPEDITTTVKTEEAANHTSEKASNQSTPSVSLDDNNDSQISTQNIGITIESTTLEALPDNISFDEDVMEVHSSSVEDKSSTPSIIQSSGFSGTQLPLTAATLHDNLQKFSSTIDTGTNTKPSVTEMATPEAPNSVHPNKIEVPSMTSDLTEPVTFKTPVESTARSTAASNQFHKSTTSVSEQWTTSHPSSIKKEFGGPVTVASTAESTSASTFNSNFLKTTAIFATEESTRTHPSTTSDLVEPVTFKSTAESITAPTSNSENDKATSIGQSSTQHDSSTVSKVISSTETTSIKVTEALVSAETSIIPEYSPRSTSEFSNDASSGFSTTTGHNHFSSHEVVTVTSLNTSTEAMPSSTIFPTQLTTKSENSEQNLSKESGIISDHETNLNKPNTGKENGSSKEEFSSNKEIPYSNNHTDEKVPQIPVVTEINSEKNGLPSRDINSGKESLNFSEKPDKDSNPNKEVPYSNHEDNSNVLQRPFVTDRPDKENAQSSKDELGSNSEKPKTTHGSINKEKDSSPKTDNEDKSKVTVPGEVGVDTSHESHILLNYTKGPLELGNQIKPSSVENEVTNTNVSKGDSLQNLSNNSHEGPPNSDELEIPYTNEVSKDDGDDTIDIPYENKVENIDTTTMLAPTEREATEETSTLTSSTTLNKATTARLIQGTSTFKEIRSTETTTEYLSTHEILSNGSTHKLSTSEKTITEASSITNNQNNSIETSTTGASERATMTVLHTSEKSSSQSSTHSTNFQNPSTISTSNFTTISTISSNESESIVSHTEGATVKGSSEVTNFSTESTLFVDLYDMSSTTIIVLTSEKFNIFSELTTEPTNIENVTEIVSTTRTTSTSPHSITTYGTENSITSASIKEPIISSTTPAVSTAGFSSTIKIDEGYILKNGTEMTTKRNDIPNVHNKTGNTQVSTNSSTNGDRETEDAKSCATTALTTGLKYGAIGGSAGAMGAVFSQIVKMIADMMKGKDNGNKKSEKDKKDSKDEHGKDNTDDVEGGQSDGGERNSEDNSSNGSKQSDLMQELNKKLDKTADEVVEQIDEEINAVEDQVVGTVKERLTEASNQILGDIKTHMMQGNGNILTNVKSMFANGENNILTDIKKRLIETKSKIFTDVKSTIKNAIDQDEDLLQLKEVQSEFFKTDETIDKNILHKGLSKSVDNINERIKSQFYQTEEAISYDIEGHMNKTENDIVQEIKTKLPQYSAIISAININMANSKNAMLKDVKGKLLQTEILLQEGIRINMNHVLFTSRQALERRTSWPIVRNDYLGQTCTLEIINEKERLLLKKKSQGVSEKLQEKKLNAIEIVNEKLQKGKTDVTDVVIKQQGFNLLKNFRKNQQPLQTISSNVVENLSGVSDPVKNFRKLSTKSF